MFVSLETTHHFQRKADREDKFLSSPANIRLKEALSDVKSGTYGGFPIRFLLYMTRLSNVIALKKTNVDKLREMNSHVEMRQLFGGIRKNFQREYAYVVLELDKINREMNAIFEGIHSFLQTDAQQLGIYDQTNAVRLRCHTEAAELVQQSHQIVRDSRAKDLITNLTSLLLQINSVADGSSGTFELSSLDDALKEIKESLCTENVKLFEDKVETSISFIKNGLQEEQSMLAPFTNNKRSKQKTPPTVARVVQFSSADELEDEEEEEEEECDDNENDPFD